MSGHAHCHPSTLQLKSSESTTSPSERVGQAQPADKAIAGMLANRLARVVQAPTCWTAMNPRGVIATAADLRAARHGVDGKSAQAGAPPSVIVSVNFAGTDARGGPRRLIGAAPTLHESTVSIGA